jgi:hypothetical protein
VSGNRDEVIAEWPSVEYNSLQLGAPNGGAGISIEDAARNHVRHAKSQLSVLLWMLGMARDQIPRVQRIPTHLVNVKSWIDDELIDRAFEFSEYLLTVPENN